MQIHALLSGHLVGNETFMRSGSLRGLLGRIRPYDFPVLSYVIEHPDGAIAIDAGMRAGLDGGRSPRRVVPRQLDVAEPPLDVHVTRVVLTHLDWDHVGGIERFPDAEVLVHRPEHEFALSARGRLRYRPKNWPRPFAPRLYDLEPEPYGPFPASRRLADDVVLVPLAGHSIGQVGVVLELGTQRLFFVGDHMLREDWFRNDERGVGLGQFFPRLSVETTRRIQAFCEDTRTVLLPAHDSEAPARLERACELLHIG